MKTTTWRRSRFCASNGQCVELAKAGDSILLRDSKVDDGPELQFTQVEMRAFILGAKAGDFDDLI